LKSNDYEHAEVEIVVETITPEKASSWLATESPNRRLSEGTVAAYARVMKEGKWQLNGEAVQFDDQGRLLNGQHRLNACIVANTSFNAVVVRGLAPETQRTMDDPRRRSINDHVGIMQLEMPTTATSAARWLVKLRLSTLGHARRIVNTEVLDTLIKHEGLAQSALKCKDYLDSPLQPSVAVAFHYIGAYLLDKKQEIEAFLSVLTSGVPSYENDPAHAWREKLLKAMRHGGRGLPAAEQFDGTAHAWNLFSKHQSEKRFTIPDEVDIEGLQLSKI